MADQLITTPRFPWDRLDDLIIFGLWFAMVVVFIVLGERAAANNLASGLMGAMAVYVKGK